MVAEVVEVAATKAAAGSAAGLAEQLSEDEEVIILQDLLHNLLLPILVQVEVEVEELQIPLLQGVMVHQESSFLAFLHLKHMQLFLYNTALSPLMPTAISKSAHLTTLFCQESQDQQEQPF
jgi:hypothetical protein